MSYHKFNSLEELIIDYITENWSEDTLPLLNVYSM